MIQLTRRKFQAFGYRGSVTRWWPDVPQDFPGPGDLADEISVRYDAGSGLVWEAVHVGRVSQKDLENLEQVVMEGVPEFFASYPFVAGNPAPVPSE